MLHLTRTPISLHVKTGNLYHHRAGQRCEGFINAEKLMPAARSTYQPHNTKINLNIKKVPCLKGCNSNSNVDYFYYNTLRILRFINQSDLDSFIIRDLLTTVAGN